MTSNAMLDAFNESDLLQYLRGLDTSVPRRSEDRTKDQTERYAVARLLSTLVGTERIGYPLTLVQRERPDFLLTIGTVQIGIEHTEAVPQNEAHKTVLREAGYGPEVYFLSRNTPGERKKSAAELIAEIEENDSGDCWGGDSVEQEWADAMFHFIGRKLGKLTSEGFERFDQDWLLIYDNWSLPALECEAAAPRLLAFVYSAGVLREFQSIYILTGPQLCELSRSGWRLRDISNLWT